MGNSIENNFQELYITYFKNGVVMVTKVAVPKLNLSSVHQEDGDCKSGTALERREQRHPVEVLKQDHSALFNALISPRRVKKEDLKDDFYAFETINQAFKDLQKLLIRSHDNTIAGRQHRANIQANKHKILQLRDLLFTTNLLGPRNTKNRVARVELCEQYVQRLYVVCKNYLAESQRVESPQFSAEVLTPRKGTPTDHLKKLQAAFQKKLRDAENLRNATVHTTVGDICALAEDYFEGVEQIEKEAPQPRSPPKVEAATPPRERVQSIFERLLSPRKKSISG